MPKAFSEEFCERAVDLVLTSGLSLRKVVPDLGAVLALWTVGGAEGKSIEVSRRGRL